MKYIIFLLLSITFLGCLDDKPPIIVPPTPTNCEYPPGSRNFTWRLDTIAWWPSSLGGIHVFSDSDAWVMGDMHGPVINGKNTSYMGLHWNGKAWNERIDFLSILMKPNDATGDDHFMVAAGYVGLPEGTTAAVAEYDNRTKQWKGIHLQTRGELRSVWTDGKGYFIAVGDNGMVYTKDGYTAEWVYSKAPTGFNLFDVQGATKSEIYLLGDSAVPGKHYQQIWKLLNNNWIKLYDNLETTNTPIQLPVASDDINSIAMSRCSITDTLYLYTVGDESYEFTTKGGSLVFNKTNLASRGLPLSSLNKSAARIRLFSPNDYWVSSGWYYLYHWNGVNFQKIEPIPTLPYGEPWGVTSRIQKNSSGKTWMILEMRSQVYAVLQAIP